MLVINARSVSEALSGGLHAIRVHGIAKPSRVGDVLVMPRPVMTEYSDPTNRVLLSPMRDANPFFHVMETLWMLAGHNDLPWLVRFNKRFASYSDDGGQTQPGAYGFRWRNHFGHDQLQDLILELKHNPDTRRCVLAMWDGGARASWAGDIAYDWQRQEGDFFNAVAGSADVPCNTHAYFDTIDGRLNMTVCCRSNDIIWGAYGANAVHFSFLLEYISGMTGIPMGVYRQFSNNYHLYTNVIPREELMPLSRNVLAHDPYLAPIGMGALRMELKSPSLRKVPLITAPEVFDVDLFKFMADSSMPALIDIGDYYEPFFRNVAVPMFNAHAFYRDKNYKAAIDVAEQIRAEDWRMACVQWLERRQLKAEANKQRFTDVVEPVDNEIVEAFGMERKSNGTT